MKASLTMLVAVTLSNASWGFDIHTHAAMTSAASSQSAFTGSPESGALTRRLGLLDPAFLRGKTYLDMGAGVTIRDRDLTGKVFDLLNRDATGLTIPDAYTLPGWMIQGSIREDDNPIETAGSDEPCGVFSRVYGHFFDPQNNRGLTAPITLGDRAVDWALSPTALADGRRNHFKITDAREAMWRALTLSASDPNGGFNNNVWPANWHTAEVESLRAESLRKAYWSTTFRALGDVVHLIQDMAQPQHTRNDAHSGYGCVFGSAACLFGHASFFEQYLRARTLQSGEFSLDEALYPNPNNPPPRGVVRETNAKQLLYAGYPKPTFNSYADYFATATNSGNFTGKGIANYSNRGFYSFGTNINSLSALLFYPSPPPDGAGLSPFFISGPADMTGDSQAGTLTLLTGAVFDTLNSGLTETNVKLSSVGMWDQFLKLHDAASSSYTLNYYNYDEQARLLVPRAVAYSAGLIDYFFRGQMEISLPDSGVYAIVDHAAFAGVGAPATDAVSGYRGFSKVRLKLKNTTADITAPDSQTYFQSMGAGTLVAVAKFHRNLDYKDNLSGEKGALMANGVLIDPNRSPAEEIVVSQFLPVSSVSSSAHEYEFTFSQEIPINATDLYLQVVFRGALGQEADAVVVATQDISEPTYFAFMNAGDYFESSNGTLAPCDGAALPCGGPLDGRWRFYRNGPPLPCDPPNCPPTPAGAFVVFKSLPVARFSRLAFLTDAQPAQQSFYNDFVSGSPPVPSLYPPAMTQWVFNPNGSTDKPFTSVTMVRSVYNTTLVPYVSAASGSISSTQTVNLSQLTTPLQDLHPVPFYSVTVVPDIPP